MRTIERRENRRDDRIARGRRGLPTPGALLFLLPALVCGSAACDDVADAPTPTDAAGDTHDAALDSPQTPDQAQDQASDVHASGLDSDLTTAPEVAPSTCAIPCLVPLEERCLPTGPCIEEPSPFVADEITRVYSNGVRACGHSLSALIARTWSGSIKYQRPDGTACFSVDVDLDYVIPDAVRWYASWKAPDGQKVASAAQVAGRWLVTCAGLTYDETLAATCFSAAPVVRINSGGQIPSPIQCQPGVDAGGCR